ncbi:MAG: class I SAM-dependent methyltransferase [Chitinophagales bacterium]
MQISEAKDLIQNAPISPIQPMIWADLGCGSGIFTQALASLLPPKSTIYAVDQTQQDIPQFFDQSVNIEFVQANFERDNWYLEGKLEGVMMANALHYVSDKHHFLKRLLRHCSKEVLFIVVEYDHMNANPWVPYPIDFQSLKKLFQEVGFEVIEKLGERKSVYGGNNMYACAIRK